MERHVVIPVKVGNRIVNEELHVEVLFNGVFRLIHSPSWVPGLASGDEFVVAPNERHGYLIKKRGGNVTVQLFFRKQISPTLLQAMCGKMEAIGARLDGGGGGRLLVFAVPVDCGFSLIESTINSLCLNENEGYWQYGNVYDPDTGELLNWWLSE